MFRILPCYVRRASRAISKGVGFGIEAMEAQQVRLCYFWRDVRSVYVRIGALSLSSDISSVLSAFVGWTVIIIAAELAQLSYDFS